MLHTSRSPPRAIPGGLFCGLIMETNPSQLASLEEDLAKGVIPDLEEIRELVADASEAAQLQEELDSLKEALGTIGLQVIDTTTDEDDQRTLEIVTLEEP